MSWYDPTSWSGDDWRNIGIGAATGGVGLVPLAASGGFSGGKGGKGSGAPAAPDFWSAADAQAASSEKVTGEQTLANRPGQTNAFGASVHWTRNPDGSWSQTQDLGGGLGRAADALTGQVADQAGSPLDNGTAVRQQAIDATYGQAASRLNPQWEQREAQTRAQLAAQGLDPGSEAFNTEMGNFGRARNDAYTSAMNNAIMNGNEAQNLTFNQNVAARALPYQELGQLRGFTEMPGFSNAGSAQAAQYVPALAAQYGAQMQGYSADQAAKNSKMSGATTLGGAGILAASDERLKTEIERLPVEVAPGVPLARWTWKDGGSTGVGVIAQDVERVRPDLVTKNTDGVRVVNYGALLAGR